MNPVAYTSLYLGAPYPVKAARRITFTGRWRIIEHTGRQELLVEISYEDLAYTTVITSRRFWFDKVEYGYERVTKTAWVLEQDIRLEWPVQECHKETI